MLGNTKELYKTNAVTMIHIFYTTETVYEQFKFKTTCI